MTHRSVPVGGRAGKFLLGSALGALLLAGPAWSHEQFIPIEGRKIHLKTDKGFTKRIFKLIIRNEPEAITLAHNPITDGFGFLARGSDPAMGKSGFISLDPTLWRTLGGKVLRGYKYVDRTGSRGGVRRVVLRSGSLTIFAKGANWLWDPTDAQESVWAEIRIGDEWYCASFSGSTAKRNQKGQFTAIKSPAPPACEQPVCGNAELELGEECDDGNLDDTDGCNRDCVIGECASTGSANSTFEAIQSVVFEGYGCNNAVCHGSALFPKGELNLLTADAYDNLVGVPSSGSVLQRVVPGEPAASFLYQKLAAATLKTPVSGAPMPSGAISALTLEHLEAVQSWIRGGAPRDLVVEGTSALLDTCTPEPDP
ncbi:MAG: hypothetical protein V3T14_00205, partial [Myxococcota bacterium]